MINPYAGMSYEKASREASRILKAAAETGNWFPIVDKLTTLRGIMERRLRSLKI